MRIWIYFEVDFTFVLSQKCISKDVYQQLYTSSHCSHWFSPSIRWAFRLLSWCEENEIYFVADAIPDVINGELVGYNFIYGLKLNNALNSFFGVTFTVCLEGCALIDQDSSFQKKRNYFLHKTFTKPRQSASVFRTQKVKEFVTCMTMIDLMRLVPNQRIIPAG